MSEYNDLPRYLSLKASSQVASVSTRTLTRAIAAGELEAEHIGRLVRIELAALLRWIAPQVRGPAPRGRTPAREFRAGVAGALAAEARQQVRGADHPDCAAAEGDEVGVSSDRATVLRAARETEALSSRIRRSQATSNGRCDTDEDREAPEHAAQLAQRRRTVATRISE